MTTYTDTATIDTTSGTPITEQKMSALKDNPVAITEGASGAPKIQVAALDPSIGIINNLAWGAVQTVTAGTATVLPLGLYVVKNSYDTSFPAYSGVEMKINGVWEQGVYSDPTGVNTTGSSASLVASDGTNCRITASASLSDVKYHKVL